jgi:hypothetical protein
MAVFLSGIIGQKSGEDFDVRASPTQPHTLTLTLTLKISVTATIRPKERKRIIT